MVKFEKPYDKVNEELQEKIYELLAWFQDYEEELDAQIAGGCVRDWRINNNIKDVDFFIGFKKDKEQYIDYKKEIEKLLTKLKNDKSIVFQKVGKLIENDETLKGKFSLEKLLKIEPTSQYDKELFVYEAPYNAEIMFQLIFVPLKLKYKDINDFIDSTFDFDINKGRGILNRDEGKIIFLDDYLKKDLNNAIITFNLSNLMKDPWRLKNIPERAARFQDKLNNFYIKIV